MNKAAAATMGLCSLKAPLRHGPSMMALGEAGEPKLCIAGKGQEWSRWFPGVPNA